MISCSRSEICFSFVCCSFFKVHDSGENRALSNIIYRLAVEPCITVGARGIECVSGPQRGDIRARAGSYVPHTA